MSRRADEKAAALEAFRHVLSHDVRSPLGAIANYAAVLEGGASELAPRLGADIRRIVGRAGDILTAGSDFARAILETPDGEEPVRLDELVGELAAELLPEASFGAAPTAGRPVRSEPLGYLVRAYLDAAHAAGVGALALEVEPSGTVRLGPRPADLDGVGQEPRAWEVLARDWPVRSLTALRLCAGWLADLGGSLALGAAEGRFPSLGVALPGEDGSPA